MSWYMEGNALAEHLCRWMSQDGSDNGHFCHLTWLGLWERTGLLASDLPKCLTRLAPRCELIA